MTEDEFAAWKSEGDNRVGRCPYCGVPGWVTGDDEWCIHYAGTYDLFNGSEPIDCLTSSDPYRSFSEALGWLMEMPAKKKAAILKGLPAAVKRFVEKSYSTRPELFWEEHLRHRKLSVDVSESLFDTTYVSLFVKDRESALKRLTPRVTEALDLLSKANGGRPFR